MTISKAKRWSIVTYKNDGWDHKTIRKNLSINNKTLLLWFNRYQTPGDVKTVSKAGRPRATSNIIDQQIINLGQLDEGNSKNETKSSIDTFNTGPSTKTITRRLKEVGSDFRFPSKAPVVSEKNKKKRVAWSNKHLDHDFKKTVISDEKVFCLNKRDGRVWCVPSGYNHRRTRKSNVKMHIWGAITRTGKSQLEHITNRVKASDYQKILNENLIPFWHRVVTNGVWYFQQDNAPPHTTKSTFEFFRSKGIKVLDWPPQSPDLSPIENLWHIIEVEVQKRKPKNKSELIQCVREE